MVPKSLEDYLANHPDVNADAARAAFEENGYWDSGDGRSWGEQKSPTVVEEGD